MFLPILLTFLLVVYVALRPAKIEFSRDELVCKATDAEADAVKPPPYAKLNARKCVVTGGCSFLGRHVAEGLKAAGVETVVILDEKKTFDSLDLTFVQQGLARKEEVMNAFEGADIVFHCSEAPIGSDAAAARRINVDYTRNVIEACTTMEVGRLVMASYATVVFDGTNQSGLDESAPKPSSFVDARARTLYEAEQLVLKAGADSNGLATAVIRAAGAFGPRDPSLVPGLAKRGKAGNVAMIGDGKNVADFTYVGNVVHAFLLAAQALITNADKANGQAFFITNNEPLPFWDFIAMVLVGLGYNTPTKRRPSRPLLLVTSLLHAVISLCGRRDSNFNPARIKLGCRNHYYKSDKAKQVMGYSPLWSLQQGLNLTLRAFSKLRNQAPSGAASGAGAGGAEDDDTPKTYTRAEVAKHNKPDDAWLIIAGKVYDVTDYVDTHRGGDAILRNVGGDATEGFNGPQHPGSVHTTVKSFFIGTLADP